MNTCALIAICAVPAHVAFGQTGELRPFNRAGRFDFACLIAAHVQVGMRATLTVTP